MLKNKPNLLITEEECRLIEAACCDNESGRHLLSQRSKEYWDMREVIHEASIAENPTDKQIQILEYIKQCSDYFYWKKLPEEDKLFIEVD